MTVPIVVTLVTASIAAMNVVVRMLRAKDFFRKQESPFRSEP